MNEEIIFRNIYEHIKVPIFVIDVEEAGDFIFSCINPAFEKDTGLRKEDVVGKRPGEIPGLSKEDSAALRTHCQSCLEGDEAVGFDWTLRGHARETWWRTELVPLRDTVGKIDRIVGSSTNVTQQRKTEQELRGRKRQYRTTEKDLQKSRDLLRAIIEAAPVAIIGLDLDGNVHSVWNSAAEKMLGWSAQEVMGLPLPTVPAEKKEEFWRFRERIGKGLTLNGIEVLRQKRDGSPIDYSIYASPLHDEEDRIVGNIAVLLDITERKKAEREHFANLKFFESMDKVNQAIQGADDIEKMMKDLLDVVISIFDCDRAYLMYPCDPESPTWTCPMERTKPEYPGVLELKLELPMDSQIAATQRIILAADGPVVFIGPSLRQALPEDVIKHFEIKCFMSIAVYPKTGSPWHFGIHQCSHARDWTAEEKRLFEAIGRRLADSLSTLLSYRDMRTNEEFLDKVVEHIPNMLFVKDAQTLRFVRFNKAGEQLLGYSREEMLGKTDYDFFSKEIADFFTTKDRQVLDSKELVDIPEETLRNKNNEQRILHTTKIPILDETGASQYLLGISEDITERRQAEEALRHSEEEKTILNQIANVFLTIPDEAIYGEVLEIVLQVMKSKFGIFGYLAENGDLVVPSLTREIWDECQVPDKSIIFPAESWGSSLWGRAIREKKTLCSDGPFRTPQGHIHIDHFITVPITYGQEPIGIISMANKEGGYTEEDMVLLERIASRISPILHARLQRDIQEQRRLAAERDLKESEEKYRLLITNAGEAIFIVQDGVVKFPNPKALEMFGSSAEELAEILFIDLIHPGDKDMVFERYMRTPEVERRPEVCPFRIKDKKGKEMWVQLITAPIVWEKKPGVLCFLRDITEEKKLESRFIQAQKMDAVGRLAGGVAHDFNNMLTVIVGHVELTLMKVSPSDPLHHQLREIDKAARRSADLTRQLLAFARKQTIAPKVLNLNDTVSGMLTMLRRLIGEDIDLVWRPGTKLWPVKMDSSQIDQVLANLCVNARDAIAGVGKVTVETGNIAFDETYCAGHTGFIPGEYVRLAVSDDGCGMDQETQAHLFEPFFTTKGIGKGTGLGLAMVHGIVKQNDGFINVYSEPEHGTTFKIYFPRHKVEPTATLEESTSETSPGKGETVLMVEDEKAVLELGKRILEESGYTVLAAMTPREAIRLAEEYTGDIHLLLTDVVMPGMNGQDLAERLVSIKPGLKCLYMSGYTADVIAHRGVLEEGVQFIPKPFSVSDLTVKVREALDHKITNDQ
jgi:PAS domain S-box-containing protein